MAELVENIHWHDSAVSKDDRQKLLRQRGVILWLTGLSGSGKSTIAVALERSLLERGHLSYRLDGDNIRHGLNRGLGFSAEDRKENIRRVGEVAKLFADAGSIVIVSFISPYRIDRDELRASLPTGDFVEIHVSASLATAEARDPKGLYKKARAGELKHMTGIDDPYEAPESPEILLNTETLSPEESVERIVSFLQTKRYLNA